MEVDIFEDKSVKKITKSHCCLLTIVKKKPTGIIVAKE